MRDDDERVVTVGVGVWRATEVAGVKDKESATHSSHCFS